MGIWKYSIFGSAIVDNACLKDILSSNIFTEIKRKHNVLSELCYKNMGVCVDCKVSDNSV